MCEVLSHLLPLEAQAGAGVSPKRRAMREQERVAAPGA